MPYMRGDKVMYRPEVTKEDLKMGTVVSEVPGDFYALRVQGVMDDVIVSHENIEGKVVKMLANSQTQPRLRENTTAYDIIFRRVVIDGRNSLTAEAIEAMMALVDFANQYERGYNAMQYSIGDVIDALGLPYDFEQAMEQLRQIGHNVDILLTQCSISVGPGVPLHQKIDELHRHLRGR